VAEAELLRAFRFRVKLRKSPGVGGGGAGAALGFSASASASLAVGTDGISASASGTASFGVGLGGPGGALLGDGGFQECTGLEVETDVQELQEGGHNDRVVKRVGRAKYQNLVLKRGMFHTGGAVNRDLWNWVNSVITGVRPVARYDGVIEVMSVGDNVVARWQFERGLPARIRGPELNAKTGEIAIEELHIAHEKLWLGI
jgi:phage tail-like protein